MLKLFNDEHINGPPRKDTMIPLKEEPTVNAALCFSEEDAHALLGCQASLANAGNVVIASARQENLLAHYTRTVLAEINKASGLADAKVAIRRMPRSSDGLLERLNDQLVAVDVATLQAKRIVKTREIWLYELPGPAQSELLQMAANMVRQFKAAGIAIIVHSRQAKPDSLHLQKLAERLRAKHVVFQTPSEAQCQALAENAKGRPEAGQIQQLIRSLGVSVEYDESANLAELPAASDLSKLMRKAEQILPSREQVQAPVGASLASTNKNTMQAPKPRVSGVSNTRVLASSGIACLLIVGLYFSPNADFFRWAGSTTSALTSNASAWLSDRLPTAAAAPNAQEDAQGEPSSRVNLPIAKPDPVATQVAVAAVSTPNATLPNTPAASTQVPQSAAEPQVVDAEAGLKALFPVVTPLVTSNVARIAPAQGALPTAFEPGVYVQHASFRLPQSALIWRNNNNQLPGVKVAAKEGRFVTVSGPFEDRGQALDYLTQFGITAQPYFIDGRVLRNSGQI
jgi:hypothetical protein